MGDEGANCITIYSEEEEMDWLELKELLDRLEDTKRPGEITSAITKAKKDMHFDGKYGAFIKMIILKDEGVKPKFNVVPPTKRILLDPFFDAAWEAATAQDGAFNHRNDVNMFLAFCSPYSDKRGKYLDEMSPQQRKVIAMMDEDMIAQEIRKKTPQEPNTIEDALDASIRARVREKGSDTP